jgi:hypothetical protein
MDIPLIEQVKIQAQVPATPLDQIDLELEDV